MYIHQYTTENRDHFLRKYNEDPASLLRIDDAEAERIVDEITRFYQDHLDRSGLDGYVVGLSGGIDSATVAHLLVDAVGAENVYGAVLPAPHTRNKDVDTAEQVADMLGIETNAYDRVQTEIDSIVDQLEQLGNPADDEETQRVKRGNILARCRMIVLRDIAKARNALVAGTTNASERELGYMTLAADGRGGVDNEALADLYKTTERDLARYLNIPEEIVEKTPTADLWPGQTDEDELGLSYDVIDQVLVGHRLGCSTETIANVVPDASRNVAEQVKGRVSRNAYKSSLEPFPTFH